MLNCSLIDFEDIYSSNFNYKKSDYIEDYLLRNNVDVLFITNYINYSLEIDVESFNDNVFYSNIEDNYKIYKGIPLYNTCNIIIIKKHFDCFIDSHEYYDNYIVQPLSLYIHNLNLTLICVDETTKYSNMHYPDYSFLKRDNTIIGGIFDIKNNNCYNNSNFIIRNNNYIFGILFKKIQGKDVELIKSKYFDNSIIRCNCVKVENESVLKYYISKLFGVFNIS